MGKANTIVCWSNWEFSVGFLTETLTAKKVGTIWQTFAFLEGFFFSLIFPLRSYFRVKGTVLGCWWKRGNEDSTRADQQTPVWERHLCVAPSSSSIPLVASLDNITLFTASNKTRCAKRPKTLAEFQLTFRRRQGTSGGPWSPGYPERPLPPPESTSTASGMNSKSSTTDTTTGEPRTTTSRCCRLTPLTPSTTNVNPPRTGWTSNWRSRNVLAKQDCRPHHLWCQTLRPKNSTILWTAPRTTAASAPTSQRKKTTTSFPDSATTQLHHEPYLISFTECLLNSYNHLWSCK